MAHQICIIAEFPGDFVFRLPLFQSGGLLDSLAPVGEWLIDHGAMGVTWRRIENVHGSALSRPGTEGSPACECPAELVNQGQSRNRGAEGGEQNAIRCLVSARRALQKKELLAQMNEVGTGKNAARLAIANLVRAGKASEFSVPRPGRKSAVFVALLG